MSAPDTASPSLAGVTVIDLTQQLPGPYATLLLAALGARVIKVEPPAGDLGRTLDPTMFATVNAGKESVTLDLKDPEDQLLLEGLAATSDVVVEGFRPGTTQRLGADYATLSAVRPDLVYCSISGFGAVGPYRAVPGHDLNYLGVGGGVAPAAGGAGGEQIGMPVVDMASGTMACLAIVAALMRRRADGRGARLDLGMLDSAVFWAGVKPAQDADGGSEPAYGVLTAADGRALTFAVLEDKFWRNLCRALGWQDWGADPALATHAQRRGRGAEIRARLRETIATRPRAEWIELLWAADVPVAPVHQPAEVAQDPQVQARGLLVDDPAMPHGVRLRAPLPLGLLDVELAPAPALGAHTRALREQHAPTPEGWGARGPRP